MKNISKYQWKNIWAGTWSFLSCSDWGEYYLSASRIKTRPFLRRVVFTFHQDKSAAWVDEDDLHDFSIQLGKALGKNTASIKKLASELKTQALSVLDFMASHKDNISLATYKRYLASVHSYYAPHIAVKYIVDALPADKLAKYLPILEEARTYAEPVFHETIQFDLSVARQISRLTKLPPDLVLHMTRNEVVACFSKNAVPSASELRSRRKNSVLVFLKKNPYLATGREADRIKNILTREKKTGSLQGQTAYPGKVSGTVRVVHNPQTVKIFNKGDILVTGMTRPEFLPLMKKAGAVVTDAGGILSHAAIVAREIRKPCVIGTKTATRTLKDGDSIEVDATQGIVKRLS